MEQDLKQLLEDWQAMRQLIQCLLLPKMGGLLISVRILDAQAILFRYNLLLIPILMKYIIYARRSQDREDKQVMSIESQLRELKKYAARYQLEIVDIIQESGSAYKCGRTKFGQMMDKIEEGKADGILTWHLSRLARNSADGGLISLS